MSLSNICSVRKLQSVQKYCSQAICGRIITGYWTHGKRAGKQVQNQYSAGDTWHVCREYPAYLLFLCLWLPWECHSKKYIFFPLNLQYTPIPVAARSKAWACSHSPAGIAGSNPTGRPSGPIGPDGLFFSQRTGSHSVGIHVPFTNCFVCRWFCVAHDPKPPLHNHNWLSFGKFQHTERFLIHCESHFSSVMTTP